MILCFETEIAAKSYRTLLREENYRAVLSIKELFGQAGILMGNDVARQCIPPAWIHQSYEILRVVEQLRMARVLSDDDIDFCFTLLPKSRRLESFRILLHQYLEESKGKDLPGLLGEWLEDHPPFQISPEVTLVVEPHSSLLYKEWTQHLAQSGVSVIESSSWQQPQTKRPLILQGNSFDLIERVTETLQRHFHPFLFAGGDTARLALLQLRLQQLKLPVETLPWIPYSLRSHQTAIGIYFEKKPEGLVLLSDFERKLLTEGGIPYQPPPEEGRFTFHEVIGKQGGERPLLFTDKMPEDSAPENNAKERRVFRIQSKRQPLPTLWDNPTLPPAPHYSASSLENYQKCPALYFYQNRLKLQKPILPSESYALILGKSIHGGLESYLKNKKAEPLLDCFKKAVQAEAPQDPITQGRIQTEFSRIAAGFEKLEVELKAYLPEGTPTLFEERFECQIGGQLFKGVFDRIDKGANGDFLVLDYKTGMIDFTPAHISRGEHFQALIYALAMEKKNPGKCAGVLFYDLKKMELRRGIVISEKLSGKPSITRGHAMAQEKYMTLLDEGLAQLQNILSRIQKQEFGPIPDPVYCDYCAMKGLCRSAYGIH